MWLDGVLRSLRRDERTADGLADDARVSVRRLRATVIAGSVDDLDARDVTHVAVRERKGRLHEELEQRDEQEPAACSLRPCTDVGGHYGCYTISGGGVPGGNLTAAGGASHLSGPAR